MTLEIDSPGVQPDRGGAVVARLERLPLTAWQIRTRIVVGAATFFDAFDALSIAFILPAVAPIWKLDTFEIGLLISSGYVGQLIGALGGGYLAERYGRKPVILGSLLLAWPLQSRLRLFAQLQHAGRVAADPGPGARRRSSGGRDVHQRTRSIGDAWPFCPRCSNWCFPSASSLQVSSHPGSFRTFGWPSLFIFGAIPALLCFAMSPFIPESPRWLVTRGRFDEAERTTEPD